MPQAHIEEDLLDRYAVGALAEEAAAAVEEHLLVCAACQTRLRQADEFAAVFQSVATAPDARPARRWWTLVPRRVAGLAAASVMAAGVFFVAIERQRTTVGPAIVSLEAMRGPEAPARTSAGKPAVLVFDVAPGSQAHEVRIVDRAGVEVASGTPAWKDGRLTLAVAGLPKGQYWVRLYGQENREPLVEYGLEAR
jgi:hypothetical protein